MQHLLQAGDGDVPLDGVVLKQPLTFAVFVDQGNAKPHRVLGMRDFNRIPIQINLPGQKAVLAENGVGKLRLPGTQQTGHRQDLPRMKLQRHILELLGRYMLQPEDHR